VLKVQSVPKELKVLLVLKVPCRVTLDSKVHRDPPVLKGPKERFRVTSVLKVLKVNKVQQVQMQVFFLLVHKEQQVHKEPKGLWEPIVKLRARKVLRELLVNKEPRVLKEDPKGI
jgi:hypothetical protein